MDDGETYAFRQSAYLHREFKYEDGVLSNSAKDNANLPGIEGSDVNVERVVVRGLAKSPVKVTSQQSGLVDTLNFTFDERVGQLVVRKLNPT